MLNCTLLSFTKKANSTKQPTAEQLAAGISANGELKENASIYTPALLFKLTGNPCAYNYCYIPSFARYYFINDWEYAGGLWIANMRVDVLASFKDTIGAQNEYIIRAADSKAWNLNTIDAARKMTAVKTYSNTTIANPTAAGVLNNGYFVVGITGKFSNYGSTTYYAMTHNQFNNFLDYLMSATTNWLNIDITELSENLQKALVNPFQYIVSCHWFPSAPPINGTQTHTIWFGWWNYTNQTSYVGYVLTGTSSTPVNYTFTDLPQHPLYATGHYLNQPPYTRRFAKIPNFGIIELPALPYSSNKVQISLQCDLVTGAATAYINVFNSSTDTIGHAVSALSGTIGAPIQVSQLSQNFMGAAKNAVNTIGAVAGLAGSFITGGGGSITDTVTTVGNNIIDGITALTPTVQSGASNGAVSAYNYSPQLITEFNLVTDINPYFTGRPVMSTRKIGDLSGYIMCKEDNIAIYGALEDEKMEVINLMNSGFYYE